MRKLNLCHNPQILAICEQAIELSRLNAKIMPYLPATLQPHCRVGSFTKGNLTLLVDDPVWGATLRFLLPELRDTLRTVEKLYQLVSLQIKVSTPEVSRAALPRHKPQLSHPTRTKLYNSAMQCTYEPLKNLLLRMCDRCYSKDD